MQWLFFDHEYDSMRKPFDLSAFSPELIVLTALVLLGMVGGLVIEKMSLSLLLPISLFGFGLVKLNTYINTPKVAKNLSSQGGIKIVVSE